MKKIIAIGASNSKKSINQQLASWAAHQLTDVEVTVLDLNDYEMPIYSPERELDQGIPKLAESWKTTVGESDAIVIAFAEYNSSYTVAFKNIFDWVSRMNGTVWQDKPMLLLATSPGPRGAQTVLSTAVRSFPYHGGRVAGSFSLPSFNQNFDYPQGILDNSLRLEFEQQLEAFKVALRGEQWAA